MKLSGKKLILNSFSDADGFFQFSSSIWTGHDQVGSNGFFITSSNYSVSIAGCMSNSTENRIVGEIQAIVSALEIAIDQRLCVQNVLLGDSKIPSLINLDDSVCSWHINPWINSLKLIIETAQHPHIHIIPLDWMTPFSKNTVATMLLTIRSGDNSTNKGQCSSLDHGDCTNHGDRITLGCQGTYYGGRCCRHDGGYSG